MGKHPTCQLCYGRWVLRPVQANLAREVGQLQHHFALNKRGQTCFLSATMHR